MDTRMAMTLVLAAAACGGDTGENRQGGNREVERQAVSAVADRLDNDQIAALVALINGTEVASAKAVEPKLVLPAARALAQTLMADHTRLMQAMPSFQGPRFTPPQAHGMNAVFRSQADMLSTLPAGTPFDATFAAIQIADHAMAIDSLRRWHQVASDQQLRQAIVQALPVMQAHLAQAQAVYGSLDVGPSPGPPAGRLRRTPARTPPAPTRRRVPRHRPTARRASSPGPDPVVAPPG